jgi:hypothetical protein
MAGPETEDRFKEISERINTVSNSISALENKLPAVEQSTRDPIPLPLARYHFTRIVLWAFIFAVFGVGVYAAFCSPADRVATLTDLLKVTLLPLVTLMIGHYFGSRGE